MRLSIVVCTHERADLLNNVLGDLAGLPLHAMDCEVMVIDNCSTDSTRDTVEKYAGQNSNIRYVFEPSVGLSHARNRGWMEARGEYVAYVDDDCRIPPEWLPRVLSIIEEKSPLAFGGPYRPFYLAPKPNWFKDDYGSYLGGRFPKTAMPAVDFNLCGGNLVVRRTVLDELGGFDPQLGMSGRRIAYAEEDHLQERIRKRWPGGLIYFDPAMLVYHLVANEKMHLRWRLRQQFQRGKSLVILHGEQSGKLNLWQAVSRFVKVVMQIVVSLLCGTFTRERKRFPFFAQWLYEETALYFAHLGALKMRVFQGIFGHG